MDDVKEILRRGVEGTEPLFAGYEDVLRRASRRDRWRRGTTAAVALAVAAAGILVAVRGFGEPSAERVGGVVPLEDLHRTWQATFPYEGFRLLEAAEGRDALVVNTDTGLASFAKSCEGVCEPLWRAEVPTHIAPQPIVHGGSVFIASEPGVLAYALDCRSDGGLCAPTWKGTAPRVPARNPYPNSPALIDGVIKVTYSRGEMPEHHVHFAAFAADCGASGQSCQPLWTGFVGEGPVHVPGVALQGRFYQHVGSSVVGFDVRCGSGGVTCEPSFRWDAGEWSYDPVLSGGEVMIAGERGLFAVPETCIDASCAPRWFADLGSYPEGPPHLARDNVVVSAGGKVWAFPIGCRTDGGACDPAWTAELPQGESSTAYVDDEIVATWTRAAEGGVLSVFSSDCSALCEPLWTGVAPGEPELWSIDRRGEDLILGGGNTVLAFPVHCPEEECVPSWTQSFAGNVENVLHDARGVFVISTEAGDRGAEATIVAFR